MERPEADYAGRRQRPLQVEEEMLFRHLSLAIACLGIATSAAAQNCSSVIANAQPGRPANWSTILNQWPWSSTCWVQWGYQGPERQRQLEAHCKQATGSLYLHFQKDFGTGANVNTCIFQLPSGTARPSQQATPSVRTETQAVTPTVPFSASPRPHPGWRQSYGSIAVAHWKGSDGSMGVATAVSGINDSQTESDTEAVQSCEEKTAGRHRCTVIYRFWNGACGYVSIAQDNTPGNCAGVSGTMSGAVQQCKQRGCKCEPAIGRCSRTAVRIQ